VGFIVGIGSAYSSENAARIARRLAGCHTSSTLDVCGRSADRERAMLDLDQHILQLLATSARGRPLTMGDLSRQFGVSKQVLLTAAHRLVDAGLATPAMVDVHGVPTMHGLLPLDAAQHTG
jgi:hypothetical protein